MAEAAASLAAMQRTLEERTARSSVAEDRCRSLETEVEALTTRLQMAESRAEAAQKAVEEGSVLPDASPSVQQRVGELEASLREAREALSTAEASSATAMSESARLRADVDGLRRQLADARSSDAMDLKRRLQEVTDALYQKQAQLERMTADKAAAQLQLERQLSIISHGQDQMRRRTAAVDRVFSGGSTGSVEDDRGYGVVPMDSLGDAYARLANAPGHLGGAVKAGARLLDSSASQAVRVLRQYPLGRLIMFSYIIMMHLFIYLLLHRLQHRAFVAGEVADGGGSHDEKLQHG